MIAARETGMSVCNKCMKPRIRYVGTGHRMIGYPYAETTAMDFEDCCECKEPDFPEQEKPSPEKVAGYKAKLARRIDNLVGRTVAEYRAEMVAIYGKNTRPRLDWMTDSQWAQIGRERLHG